MSAERHDDAIAHYSAMVSLNPAAPGLFINRSQAYLDKGSWEDALNDANKAIELDPSSPWGYERKHAALHKARDYENAIDAFETMFTKVSESSDPDVRGEGDDVVLMYCPVERSRQYVDPSQTKAAIRAAIQNVIRESPPVLINTTSGRLLDKCGQAFSFESQPIFGELVSFMTTHIDHTRIEQEVAEYYRYATFSHKLEGDEPLFEKVVHIIVYDLEESPTHDKLQMFCKIARGAGLHWAWSDPCCINKADHVVLQEALVSMFKWYQGSAVTIVFLRGVRSPSRRGDLVRSIWHTCSWTLQQYHASEVVRFYNDDWTLYMNLDIPNHKESPEIISEMEGATGVSARSLMALRPDLDDIRVKLRLASTRQATRVEDTAYSLLGMFSISLPVVYGEGDQALGRLLAQLLTSSGDASILAWTGRSGGFNSCLPANITAFSQPPTTHIPSTIKPAEMDMITARSLASSPDSALVMKLYDRLNELPVPSFVEQQMKLPCITFKLGAISASQSRSIVFRAETAALGIVEIRTREDLSRLDSLYLIHPWIDFLLDRQPIGSIAETMPGENVDEQSSLTGELPSSTGPSNITSAVPQTQAAQLIPRLGQPFGGGSRDVASPQPPSPHPETDKEMRALRLMTQLRQPFGALLFTPTRQNVAEYRRVVADSLATVQVEEITPTILNELLDGVCMLDVL